MVSDPATVFASLQSIGTDCIVGLDDARSVLSKEELVKAEAFKFDKHRNRYVRGRALLRMQLGELLKCPPETIILKTGKFGKPYETTEQIQFNLSHSGDLAWYGYSFDLPAIGLDIERIDRNLAIEGLAKHYFTADEQEQLSSSPHQNKHELFFKIWTAKEARMKLTGEGLHLDPRDIDLDFRKHQPCGYLVPPPTTLDLRIIEFPEFSAIGSITAERPLTTHPLETKIRN